MDKTERKQIEWLVSWVMTKSISNDYVRHILEHTNEETGKTLMDEVIDNVMETSAWEDEGHYNEDDVRLAIGRVLVERLEIEI
jgi:hypothetical protein